MSETHEIMPVYWDDGHTYHFLILNKTRTMYVGSRKDRCKGVYRGYFQGTAPKDVEPDTICWLKQIQLDDFKAFPQLREQYDVVNFPKDETHHIRRLLARNSEAERVANGLCDEQPYFPQRDCFTVERSYSELVPNQIQNLTPWERLEYLYQYCAALQELYDASPSVYGRPVAAHRDVKLGNGLILRGQNCFRVILLDFSSIRFAADPAKTSVPQGSTPAHISAEGNQGTKPYLMSNDNTCLEIVCSDYPTTRAVDVYALGTMLASMFGYVTPSCRNPNIYFCTAPDGQDETKRKALDTTDLCSRFYRFLDLDKSLGQSYTGTTWMEEALQRAHTHFTWGDPQGAPYAPDEALLEQVKALFFRATRIDPADRIDMESFRKRIRELKQDTAKRFPAAQRSNSPRLYEQPEDVYLIHQKALLEQRTELETVITNAAKRSDSRFPVQLCWYQNKQDNLYRSSADPIDPHCVQTVDELIGEIHTRDAVSLLPARNLTHTLYQLWSLYSRYRYEKVFSGTVHIFGFEPFERDMFKPIKLDGQVYTFNQFLMYLGDFMDGELKVRFHSPAEPEHWEKHPSFKWVSPAEDGLQWHTDWDQESDEPETEPVQPPQPQPSQPQKQTQPEAPVERLYLLGSEGLFFLDQNGRKVYVTRKKIRR